MQMLSALDAISPAFQRTKLVLFSPFRAGRTWKFSATAYLSVMGSMFLPFPLIYLAFVPEIRKSSHPGLASLAVCGILAATVVFLLLFYVFSRLRFALFDVVVLREQYIAPAWRKYGSQTLKWTGVKVLIGLITSVVIGVPGSIYLRGLMKLFVEMSQPHVQPQALPADFFRKLISFYAAMAVVYLVVGIFYMANMVLCDFIEPSLALEGTTLGEAFRRMGVLVRNEPGQFSLYCLMKVMLGFVGYLAGVIAFELVFIFVGLILALMALCVGFVLHLMHVPVAVLMVMGFCLLFAYYVFCLFYGLCLLMGCIGVWMQAYAVYFLGGRYPLLGDLLDQSTPLPPLPPPVWPPEFGVAYQPPDQG